MVENLLGKGLRRENENHNIEFDRSGIVGPILLFSMIMENKGELGKKKEKGRRERKRDVFDRLFPLKFEFLFYYFIQILKF